MTISFDPPVGMPLWMVIIPIIVLLLVAAWLIGSFISTRRDRSLSYGDIPMAPTVRDQWITKIDAVEARFRTGELDLRALHLELASILRGFAGARSGADIESSTVLEILDIADTAGPRSPIARLLWVRAVGRPLDTNPLGHVGELLAVWEQPSFDREPRAAAERSLTSAREVVTRW
ncbi:alpha-amylase [Actinomyces trachealis]|uniref:alpha-amylase n=1 Tax=Actinomyces trachealis TaxID=2763540 RepID=UPI001FD269AA|nr:alpha-amylase [Actinomyces trachealis]